jgi:hypothetical protein
MKIKLGLLKLGAYGFGTDFPADEKESDDLKTIIH